MLVQERGIDLEPTDDYLQEVRLAGGEDELISALQSAKVTKPEHIDPIVHARQAEVGKHVTRGLEFMQAKRDAAAEAEYIAALRLDPQNDEWHADLGAAPRGKGDLDGEIEELRGSLQLNPNDDVAHYNLSAALAQKGDWDGAIAEDRERLPLNPKDENALSLAEMFKESANKRIVPSKSRQGEDRRRSHTPLKMFAIKASG